MGQWNRVGEYGINLNENNVYNFLGTALPPVEAAVLIHDVVSLANVPK